MAKVGTEIFEASNILKNGGLVAIPTETVYGLAANALSEQAVVKIFKVKKRPDFNPLIVHDTKEKIKQWASVFYLEAQILAEKFWPGPLTLVLPKSKHIPYQVTSGLETVGLRVPNHILTTHLLEELDFPLAAPSANPFGYISPTEAQHVVEQLGNDIDYVLDGGNCNIGVESTIVGFEKGKIVIYRLGGISVGEIEKVVGKVEVKINTSSNPKSPGMLKSHYAPLTPLILLDEFDPDIADQENTAFLLFNQSLSKVSKDRQFNLSLSGNFFEAAANLYAMLRKLDNLGFKQIIAFKLPKESLGDTINDRLTRAAV